MLKNPSLLFLCFSLTAISLLRAQEIAPATPPNASLTTKPNVLLILSDDAGFADFGFQGSKQIPTPNLDALRASGILCTQSYASGPLCSPSRAGLMSGKWPAEIGHENNLLGKAEKEYGLDASLTLFPARMKKLGYDTGAIGKWHLGSKKQYWPWKRGFDYFFGFLGGGHPYLEKNSTPVVMLENGNPVTVHQYLTDEFGDRATQFIDKHRANPWFLYLAFNAVHTPFQADPAVWNECASIQPPSRRMMAAMMISMDREIGKIVNKLKADNLLDNTLIIFTNDNGGAPFPNYYYNVPLRGCKATLFEGGTRVPMLMSWKGHLKAGAIYDKPVINLDLLATSIAAGGGAKSLYADTDSVDLLPFLEGKNAGEPHQRLFWRLMNNTSIREGDWKLINVPNQKTMLFNLAADPSEKDDLAAKNPKLVAQLLSEIQQWQKNFPPASWDAGKKWDDLHMQMQLAPPTYQGPDSQKLSALIDEE